MTIKKAVIPVGGLGTRFLPATKAQPKEMLPIVDKPAVQYIVEEAVKSGIESIIFITGRNKKSIEDHFDKSIELEQMLEEKHKFQMLKEVQTISSMASIHYIRQKEPLGLGHAILCAEQFIGDEPFAVLLGDDIMTSEEPALKQMIQAYETTNQSVIGVQKVDVEEVSKYGIIQPKNKSGSLYEVNDLIEKPSIEQAPSTIAVMGRYILNPSIFSYLKTIERGVGNELQLTDALRVVCEKERLFALELEGQRFDIGDKVGYMKAMVEVALKRRDLRQTFLSYLEGIVEKERANNFS
ncbi:UTP--glucose-1-phosphate uridylyltransferase GalU [Priestia aryabhattai]|jgi:UTP--glucose-1-phosphate uridylyltransferase|uniref:UTP--glucose-1-phosphate uridylyltransferase GalU n=1 Tax=Priestia TaxID=2800373 RepID=UPI001ECBB39D|nr:MULTISPECIES: UTP--glucose-1-phosphate uridylyltransferase GalU [Priestia]MBY0093565.1 UTP--glucose-1-phosphate uridylyltransferase GalU [Priestia aryabhattai]MBY0104850.1 UTP--glucose-1-phosphate uridylyltransferase GalU [Priestia aryabhattai]MCM3305685.1 UTP--glucose-1-phosphate uridylyltransferase GalU [Priestia megaterium]